MNKLLGMTLAICVVFTACSDKLQYQHFNDVINMTKETKDYQMAIGKTGTFYIYSGEMHLKGENVLAGEAVAVDHRFRYPIYELLKKYPLLKNEKSLKAAAAQLEMWKHHPPEVTIRRPD